MPDLHLYCICPVCSMYACSNIHLRCSTASASNRDARTLCTRACPRCSSCSAIHSSTFFFHNRILYVKILLSITYSTHIHKHIHTHTYTHTRTHMLCMRIHISHLYGVFIELMHPFLNNIGARAVHRGLHSIKRFVFLSQMNFEEIFIGRCGHR